MQSRSLHCVGSSAAKPVASSFTAHWLHTVSFCSPYGGAYQGGQAFQEPQKGCVAAYHLTVSSRNLSRSCCTCSCSLIALLIEIPQACPPSSTSSRTRSKSLVLAAAQPGVLYTQLQLCYQTQCGAAKPHAEPFSCTSKRAWAPIMWVGTGLLSVVCCAIQLPSQLLCCQSSFLCLGQLLKNLLYSCL